MSERFLLFADLPAAPMSPMRIGVVALMVGAALGIGVAFLTPPLAVMGLVGVAFGLAIFARPELGLLAFVATACLLPFAVIPVRLGFSLTLIDAIVSTLLAAWLFWTIYRGRPIVGNSLNGAVLLYLGLALVSFVLGLTYSISPERLRLFLKSINGTLLFFTVMNCVQTRTALKRLLASLLLCGAAASAIALALLLLPESTAAQLLSSLGPLGYPTGPGVLRPIADTDILRAIGTSIDPNVLGGLLMTVSVMLVGQLFSPSPVLNRKLLWMMAVPTIAALLLTYSRSAWGGFIVGAMIVATFRNRRLWILMVLAAITLPFLPQAEVFLSRFQSGLAFQDRAAAMRLDEYTDAINLIANYPWFGIGFGEPPSIDLYLGVSSIYLLLGQEMGLIGLSSFLLILSMLAFQMVAGLRAAVDEEIRGLLLSLAAALGAAAVAGLFDHYFINLLFPHMVALLWFLVGLATVAARMAQESQGRV